MAITLHPKRTSSSVAATRKDAQAHSFISGAGSLSASGEDDASSRKPVVVRIPSDLLRRIDLLARKKAISRSSFIVSSLADLVNEER